MKTARWAFLATLSLVMPCLGQALTPSPGWSVIDRGENFRIWARTSLETNASGEMSLRTASLTELTPGASRWEAGRWVEATPQLVVTNNGILGTGARWSAFFAANLNSHASVQVFSPQGPALKMHILGLVFQDCSTGTNIWLARLKDSTPHIVGSNQVVYADAFEGALCDVRYTYGQSGVSQDVIVKEALPSPSEWGMEPTNTHLVVVSEVVEGPTPAKRERTWRSGQEVMRDQTLDFGSGMVMVPGRAFDLNDTSKRRSFPVAKQFEIVDGRRLIAERVRFSQVQPALAQLSPPGMSLTNVPGAVTTNSSIHKLKRWLAQGALPPAPEPMQPTVFKVQRVAALGPQPGFVLDWELMTESFDWHFSCNTNYLIASKVHLANAVFEPQTRIRYAPGASLYVDGALTWMNASECGGNGPALLTSINDDAENHGELIEGWGSGAPAQGDYGPALVVRPEDLATAQSHFAVCYARPGIISGTTAPAEVTVVATNWAVAKGTTDHATFTIQRDYGDWSQPLTVQFQIRTNSGPTNALATKATVTIPANQASVAVPVPFPAESASQYETTVTLALSEDAASAYSLGEPQLAAVSVYNASAAASAPVTAPQGLVAWWRGENNALDSAGSNHGQLLNGLGFGPGKVGQGFSFDGVDDRMTVANAPALNFGPDADFSIEAWISPITASTTYGVQAILDKRYTPDSSRAVGYTLYLVNGRLGFQFADGPLSYSYSGYGPAGADLRDSRLHHVAVIVDRDSTSGGKLYVDGLEVLSFNPTSERGDLSNTDPLRIGNHAQVNFNGNFKGIIDEVSLYNRALTAAEIQSIYNAGSGGKAIPPSITTHPVSQTVNQGANVTFSVTAVGTAPLNYQWTKNGIIIAGANVSSFTINSVQLSDAGTYAVRVSNTADTVASTGAVLTVIPSSWLTQFFGPNYLNDPRAAPNMDPDQDGMTNLEESQHNTNPLNRDSDRDGMPDDWEIAQGLNPLDKNDAILDPDFDGRSNLQEFQDGTDPHSNTSVKHLRLARWRFQTPQADGQVLFTYNGEEEQAPTYQSGAQFGPSWDGFGLRLTAPEPGQPVTPTGLSYGLWRDNGSQLNLTPSRGAVSFWFKPNWTSGQAVVPGSSQSRYSLLNLGKRGNGEADELEAPYWGLEVDGTGSHLLFCTRRVDTGGTALGFVTLATTSIQWTKDEWYQIVLSYSEEGVAIYVNGQPAVTATTSELAALNPPGQDWRIWLGGRLGIGLVNSLANGTYDLLETYNYQLAAGEILTTYQQVAQRDSDQDGVTDLDELKRGTCLLNPDTDGDGLPDGWEVKYGLNPLDKADAAHTASNGRTYLDNFLYGLDPTSSENPIVDYIYDLVGTAADRTRLINVDFGSPPWIYKPVDLGTQAPALMQATFGTSPIHNLTPFTPFFST